MDVLEAFIFLMSNSCYSSEFAQIYPLWSLLKLPRSYVTLGEPIAVWASSEPSFNVGSFVIVAFWGRKIKTKWISVIFFKKKKKLCRQLAKDFYFYSIVGKIGKKIYIYLVGWVRQWAYYQEVKNKWREWKAKINQQVKQSRQELEKETYDQLEKDQEQVFWHGLIFTSLKLLFSWENASLFYSFRDTRGEQFWWQELGPTAAACWPEGQEGREETHFFSRVTASLL